MGGCGREVGGIGTPAGPAEGGLSFCRQVLICGWQVGEGFWSGGTPPEMTPPHCPSQIGRGRPLPPATAGTQPVNDTTRTKKNNGPPLLSFVDGCNCAHHATQRHYTTQMTQPLQCMRLDTFV
eukprot:scaffold65970_cov51-Prasinocladus_malaysianus.AAC.2